MKISVDKRVKKVIPNNFSRASIGIKKSISDRKRSDQISKT